MSLRPICCFISQEASFAGRAEYSLRVLLEGIGLPCLMVNDLKNADLVYSATRPTSLPACAFWMQSCGAENWDLLDPELNWEEGIPWVGRLCDGGALKGDILFSAFALLTGAFEIVEFKDHWGVPIARGSRYEALGLLTFPAIAKYCELLLKALNGILKQDLETIPLWPGNKRYAIVLSHDVDAPLSFADIDYRKKWLWKQAHEGNYLEVGRGIFGYARTLAKKALGFLPNSENDPNFCFEAWVEFEGILRAKSAFYFATASSADVYSDIRDVSYLHNRDDLIRALNKAIDRGWEVGLHGSMNAWRDESRISQERNRLEQILPGYALKGIRHHFWALDNEIPERTLAMHARVGFEYDSSLGLNDAPGYRRGISWPFTPFDKSSCKSLPILEIPPTIMDGGIFYREISSKQGKEEILTHIKKTFDVGGAVVMNWHLEQMNPNRLRQAGPTLMNALIELTNDSELYWASPSEICDWWNHRRTLLSQELS